MITRLARSAYDALLQHCTPLQNEVRRSMAERFNEEHGEALLRLASAGHKARDFFSLPEQAKSHTLTNEDGMELPLLPGEEP